MDESTTTVALEAAASRASIQANVAASPDLVFPAISSSSAYNSPKDNGKLSCVEVETYPPTANGPTRQSSRTRRSPQPRGTASDPTALRDLDPSDINVNVDGTSVLVDEIVDNGGSCQSSRKRHTRSPIRMGIQDVSVPFVTGADSEPAAKRQSSRRTSHSSDRVNLTIEKEEGSLNAGGTRQSTRSRTPRVTYASEFNPISFSTEDSAENQQPLSTEESEVGDDVPSIDAAASSLAMLDARAYQRTLLCDSNELLRRIIQPVALPWTHKGNPISRNTAFDIDDMTETLMADDGSFSPYTTGPLGFGRFDIGQLRRGPCNTRLATSSDSLCSASRRSIEPGVLEVSSIALPLFFPRKALQSVVHEEKHDLGVEVVHAPDGEISLQYYELSARSRRSKVAQVRSSARQHLVSVKVGSSSSRSSIFTDIKFDTESRYGRLLEATLPAEVQTGKVLSNSIALQVAEILGSYDCRHGLSKIVATAKSPRSSCGRTRLVWTDRSGPADQPQKVVHTSLLSGGRLESGPQKRPREIKVAVRVGGERFGCSPNANEPSLASQESAVVGRACSACVLDDEEMVKNILADVKKSSSERSKARARAVSAQPILDCLPDSNGAISVVCTSPGKVALSSVHERLNHAAKVPSLKCCTVCWLPDEGHNHLVHECVDCGTLAHAQCCYDGGEVIAGPDESSDKGLTSWRCPACCFKKNQPAVHVAKNTAVAVEIASRSRRKSKIPQWLQDSHIDDTLPAGRPDHMQGEIASHGIKCVLCPYHGGAMSRVKGEHSVVWMHEVCRVWQNGVVNNESDGEKLKLQCALCGKTEKLRTSNGSSEKVSSEQPGLLIKCASSRCQVVFHPMCALLSSKMSSEPSSVDYHPFSAQGVDQRLCASFTLSAVTCESSAGKSDQGRIVRRLIQIPIGFCGIHNPKRVATSRGLYPAGKHINEDSIRIPALRQDSA